MVAWQQRRSAHTTVTSRQHRDGQVMIIFALASFVLVGVIALSVDTGFLMAERRQTQSAADAAALAAAADVLRNKSFAVMQASGKDYGATNANVPAGNVTINHANHPRSAGIHTGTTTWGDAFGTGLLE